MRPGIVTPVPAEDALAGIVGAVLVPLLERRREIVAGQAKGRMGGRHKDDSTKENLPELGEGQTRDAVTAEIGTPRPRGSTVATIFCHHLPGTTSPPPARIDRQLVDLVLIEVLVDRYRWRAQNRVIKR